MTGLGLLVHSGVDAEESPADWFERAADAGDPQGRFLYAVALSEGDGRDRDADAARLLVDGLIADSNVDSGLKEQAKKLRRRLR